MESQKKNKPKILPNPGLKPIDQVSEVLPERGKERLRRHHIYFPDNHSTIRVLNGQGHRRAALEFHATTLHFSRACGWPCGEAYRLKRYIKHLFSEIGLTWNRDIQSVHHSDKLNQSYKDFKKATSSFFSWAVNWSCCTRLKYSTVSSSVKHRPSCR